MWRVGKGMEGREGCGGWGRVWRVGVEGGEARSP